MTYYSMIGSGQAAGDPAKRYYKIVFDSTGSARDCRVAEIKIQIGGSWATNAMTAASTGTLGGHSATITESSYNSTHEGWRCFDANENVYWTSGLNDNYDAGSPYDATGANAEWVAIDFGAGNAEYITGLYLKGFTTTYAPDEWHLEWSDNGSTWNEITESAGSGDIGDSADSNYVEHFFTWSE